MLYIDLVVHLAVFNINIEECIITNGDIACEISREIDKNPGRTIEIAPSTATKVSATAG